MLRFLFNPATHKVAAPIIQLALNLNDAAIIVNDHIDEAYWTMETDNLHMLSVANITALRMVLQDAAAAPLLRLDDPTVVEMQKAYQRRWKHPMSARAYQFLTELTTNEAAMDINTGVAFMHACEEVAQKVEGETTC